MKKKLVGVNGLRLPGVAKVTAISFTVQKTLLAADAAKKIENGAPGTSK